jgi:hypothetical protein
LSASVTDGSLPISRSSSMRDSFGGRFVLLYTLGDSTHAGLGLIKSCCICFLRIMFEHKIIAMDVINNVPYASYCSLCQDLVVDLCKTDNQKLLACCELFVNYEVVCLKCPSDVTN